MQNGQGSDWQTQDRGLSKDTGKYDKSASPSGELVTVKMLFVQQPLKKDKTEVNVKESKHSDLWFSCPHQKFRKGCSRQPDMSSTTDRWAGYQVALKFNYSWT